MRENKESGRNLVCTIRMLLLSCICFLAVLLPGSVCMAEESTHSLQFFFENVCASCSEEDEFYDLFNRVISIEEKQEISYEIRTYNVFRSSDMEVYEEKLAEYGMTRTDIELPVLLVDGQWISSYTKIEEELHGVLLEHAVVSDVIEEETSTEETNASEEDVFSEAWNSLEEQWSGLLDDTPAILLFSTYSCADCESAKEYLDQLKAQGIVSVMELNVSEGNHLELFKELLQKSGREDTEGKVPAVFAGGQMLLGKEEIKDQLETLIDDEDVSLKTLKEDISGLAGSDEEETIRNVSLPVMFGAGLLAGFNPCAISMILMLFSILLTGQSSVLKNGLLYLGGKFVTYLGIGLVFYLAAAQIDQQLLNQFQMVTGMVIAVLFLAAAVLNFMDFRSVRKQEYGKIRMQLPVKLRQFNHKLLKHAGHMEGTFLSLLVFGLGIAISIGEFFCSGQIYMASLLYLARNGTVQLLQLIGTLAVYVAAMSIPAAVILIVIHKTKKTERVSEFMLEHMAAIKLLNTVLFLAYAVYFIADGIL